MPVESRGHAVGCALVKLQEVLFVAETKKSPKPTEEDVNKTKEEDKNLDRDGGERQPNQQTNQK